MRRTLSRLAALGLVAAATLAAILLDPAPASAWGPGVHLAVGNTILCRVGEILPHLATLLVHNADAFLYGCLSADIFIGKGCRPKPRHSHNWAMGLDLLTEADTPQVKAYAYGYLSHLAADVPAHNYFIPNRLSRMTAKGRLPHVYLEAMADRLVDWDSAQPRQLFRVSHGEADQKLLATLRQKQMLFDLRKRLMKGGFMLWDSPIWKRSLTLMDRALPLVSRDADLTRMLSLSLNAAADVLRDPRSSAVLGFDPVGSRNLHAVNRLRRVARRRLRRTRPDGLFTVDERLTRLPVAC